jgi:hypothetical protein
MKGKNLKHHKFFLMLKTNKANLSPIIRPSSICLSNLETTSFYSLSFKLIEIVKCSASLSSQCPSVWLKRQVETIGERQCTIM